MSSRLDVRGGDELARWLPRLASYLYLVDLIPDKRVLELGCSDGVGCEFLANYGAREVLGIDRSRSAIRRAREGRALANVEYRCHLYYSIEVPDSSVDLVFAPDATELLRDRRVLAELSRVLAPEGHVVWTLNSADRRRGRGGLSYHEVVERLSAEFEPVRMIAMSPFAGWSAVEFANGEPSVELDTSLLSLGAEEEPVTHYIALCGGAESEPRSYAVLQLPVDLALAQIRGVLGNDAVAASTPAAAGAAGAAELLAMRAKVAELTREFAAARAALAAQRELLVELESGIATLSDELSRGGSVAAPHTRAAALSEALGARDAEVAMLTIGLRSLKAHLTAAARELEESSTPEGITHIAHVLRRLAGGSGP